MAEYDLIGNQLDIILQQKISKLPVQEVGDIFVDKIEIDSNIGVDPTGKPYEPYKKSTAKKKGRSSPVTLRDRSRSIETIDSQARSSDTARLTFSGQAGYGKSSKDANIVFFDYHQHGTENQHGTEKMKKRKVVPEEEDLTSAGVEEAIQKVELLLEGYFNE